MWGFLWGDENVLELDRVMVTQHYECTKCHKIVYFTAFKMRNSLTIKFEKFENACKLSILLNNGQVKTNITKEIRKYF